MAKAKRKPAIVEELDGPTPEQLANGDFTQNSVPHPDGGNRIAQVQIRSGVLDRWIQEAGPGFEQGAATAIRTCQFYWNRLGRGCVTSRYSEPMPRGVSDGVGETEALSELAYMAKGIPEPYWATFEMVARWDEPAGYAGSSWAKNTAQQIQSAKIITGMVASLIAAKMGY